MYHGIVIDKSFKDKSFPKTFKCFARKQDGSWGIYGIEVEDSKVPKVIKLIQHNMRSGENWYAHLYNDKSLILIFKEKIFSVKSHISTWDPIIEYGKRMKIPKEQLDFWPNRFQDEIHYFVTDDFC